VRIHVRSLNLNPVNFWVGFRFSPIQQTANVIANDTVIVLRVDPELLDGLRAEIREKIKDKIIAKLVARLDFINDAYAKLF